MFLLPNPLKLEMKEGAFFLDRRCEIVLNTSCDFKDMETARLLKKEIESVTGFNILINRAFAEKPLNNILLKRCSNKQEIYGEKEGYKIIINENGVEICAGDNAGLFYGIQTLRQVIRQNAAELPALIIEDKPYFKNRGFYHDVTRGKVPTLETLKELVDRASFYKINHLELYIEHSFAFKNLSEIWMDKDPLTAEEILELDEYCIKRHVELVPSLSTFGHLYELLTSRSYAHLCELEVDMNKPYSWMDRMRHHTLDVSNEESIKVVEDMLAEFVPLFSSKKFNICCDETFDLGKGKNSHKLEKLGSGRLYVDFLNKVIKAMDKYDKEVMFWGDIILKHPEYLSEIPKDVTCLNWGYHAGVTEDDTRTVAESGLPQYVCPSVTGWNRMMNEMDNAFINIIKMVEYGKKYNAVGVLNTDWGDFGHVNLFGNSMPGMIFAASLTWNPEGEKDIEIADEAISTLEYGKDSKGMMKLLRELSRQQPFHWSFLTFWKERELHESEYIAPWMERVRNIDHIAVTKAYHKAVELEKELIKIAKDVSLDRRIDMEEFIISAEGVVIMEALFLAIKKYSFGFEEVELVMEPKALATKIEYWLADYCNLWRKRNKESELQRIKETFIYVTNFLRDIK